MKLIFEISKPDRKCCVIPKINSDYTLPQDMLRKEKLNLPEIAEVDLVRHYTNLSRNAFGVDNGFYPLGSCTMKYNPKVNEDVANLSGFTNIHPLQPEHTAKGCLEIINLCQKYLCGITGMDAMSMQPTAGAHGEYTALNMIRKYFAKNANRNKILVPDSAHGTNPASAAMNGFKVVTVPSNANGLVDIDKLRELADDSVAALMLTNPNTLGLFETDINEIAEIIHSVGGLLYYDGANMNAIMGISRPGDMGFDLVHLNLHKTFSTPHGGGGPGSGPVGCKAFLKSYLPNPIVNDDLQFENNFDSIGRVASFYGNFSVYLKALSYILCLGRDGLKNAAQHAVLNANYLATKLSTKYNIPFTTNIMHEFVVSLSDLKKQTGVTAGVIAKNLIDNGIHPPTMYFPLIVPEALMIEPTETESIETLDNAVEVFNMLYEKAMSVPESLMHAPQSTPVKKIDEVRAARKPIVKYEK